MKAGCVVSIQDMGAAGLTCSAVEMGAKGDLGIELDLDAVPCRETGMTAYEMMLSESQERMLMVLAPGKEAEAEAIFRKWGLDFAIIGRTTDTLRFVVKHKGLVEADPADQGTGRRGPGILPPLRGKPGAPRHLSPDVPETVSVADALDRLIMSPTSAPSGGCGSSMITSSSATPCRSPVAMLLWYASRMAPRHSPSRPT